MTDVTHSDRSGRFGALRRNLRLLTADGATWAIMTGTAEWQFALFALAIGLSEVMAGLVGTVPLFAGAVLQLVTPWGVRRVGSIRLWVWVCAAIQACALLPLAIGAFSGTFPWWGLYACVCIYWASGFATAPPWQSWFTTLVPSAIRPTFVGHRDRFVQAGLACGMLAGLFLQFGESQGWPLIAFGVVFVVSFLARIGSTICLANQSDAEPGLVEKIEGLSPSGIRRDFADRRTRQLLLYMLAYLLSVMIVGPYFVVYMRKELHFEYWQITAGLFVMILVKAMILPYIGRLAKRIGPGRVLWIGAVVTMPMAALWAVDDSFLWIVVVQTLAAIGWACWETATFLLIFDIIPAERRTSVLTVYQFVRAAAFLIGSLIGAAILELFGVGPTGYIALFVISSLMRFVTLFMLASLEPTGLQLRDRTRKGVVRAVGFLPGINSPD
ncbi:MAG: hypothetical protein CMJ33_11280 [Phycisphaerae bacterium]|nr:hypothetical protein [Phycisphaerae bacterium]